MAVAPDGSFYFGDWVLRDYPVHGRGRIWRLMIPMDEMEEQFPPRSSQDVRASQVARDDPASAIASDDPFVHAAGTWQLAHQVAVEAQIKSRMISNPRTLLGGLIASRLRGTEIEESLLRQCTKDDSPEVRLYAVRWIADERIKFLRDDVAKLLDAPQPSQQYYLAVLAAIDWLDNEPEMRAKEIADELLVRELRNTRRSADVHTLALGLVSPGAKYLTMDRLKKYMESDHRPLRLEAVRKLAQRHSSDRFDMLASIAADEAQDEEIRAEAIMGLSAAADKFETLLERLATGSNRALSREAERALRLVGQRPAPSEVKPAAADLSAWVELLNEPGDAQAGRRFFFSQAGARCGVCHQHGGRGGRIGPDLTNIGRSNTREKIIESILQPDQEVAPHYQPWLLVTDDGKTHTGLRMHEGGDDGSEEYVNSAGERFLLESKTIEVREATATSIMPSGLETTVSIADLRDLVTFLMESK
jgi:putative heme-binding domain-containing protein